MINIKNMKIIRAIAVIPAVVIAFACAASTANAATYNVISDKTSFKVGDTFSIDLKIDSEGTSINAAQASINYPANILQAVSADKTTSVFNFWLEDPKINASQGTISFTAGSTSGFTGRSLETLRVTFQAKSAGAIDISISDAAITAADNKGTNVLTGYAGFKGAITSIIPSYQPGALVEPPFTPIIRQPAAATGLPGLPKIEVPLYPNQDKWSNASTRYIAKWDLPADITAVAVAVDKIPETQPSSFDGLYDNRMFPPLTDGIWYLHVKFKNLKGTGPTATYKIKVDTTPPLPFDIKFSGEKSSDNPSPSISFNTIDQPSGIAEYSIKIDDSSPVVTDSGSVILKIQAIGKHIVKVAAKDQADNITETATEFEVLPIAPPVIISYSKRTYVTDGTVEISGSVTKGNEVIVVLKEKSKAIVVYRVVSADENGNWRAVFSDPLKKGEYYLEAMARDVRGATSLPVESGLIEAVERPLVIIFGIEISPTVFYLLIIVILSGGLFLVWLMVSKMIEKRRKRVILAERDIENSYSSLEKEINNIAEEVNKSSKKISAGKGSSNASTDARLKRMISDIQKSKKYLEEDIKDIKNHE